MAYRLQLLGIQVECDSAAEVAALAAALDRSNEPAKSVERNGVPPATPAPEDASELEKFYRNINHTQRSVLQLIAGSYPHPIEAERIAQTLGLDLPSIGWARRAMKKIGKLYGVPQDRLVKIQKVIVDGKPRTAYLATTLLKSLVEKMKIA